MTEQAFVSLVYWCDGCSNFHDEGECKDAGPIYECQNCGTRFNRDNSADGGSARCPDCNKFSQRQADVSCPEGNCDEDLEEIAAVVVGNTTYLDLDAVKEHMS